MANPTTMRAAVFAPGGEGGSGSKWDLVEQALPEPGEGECRVKIEACGICGSDLHFYHANMFAPGLTPGHEMAGTVDAVGPGVSGISEGQRVTVEPVVGCGTCRHCAAGDSQICPGMRVHGFMLPGGFAEYANVPARGLFPVANDVSAAVAALGEPLAVSIHGLDRGRFEPGQRVLILGAGTVGLVTLVVARALGAGEVWVSARYPHQADLANDLGAKRVLREEEARAESLDVLGREQDFDLVVETVGGSAETLRDACAAVRPGGAVTVLGVFNGSPTLEPFRMLLKECTLSWSNCYCHPSKDTADFARATALIDSERDVLDRITTHQLPLERVADAFALADDKKSGAVKVTLQP